MVVCYLCKQNNSNIGLHLQREHYKCNQCYKWFLNAQTHLLIKCKLCLSLSCKMHDHLMEMHYHCDLCSRWVKNKNEHILIKCDKCGQEVCNINHHKSLFINCQEPKLIGTNEIKVDLNLKFVTVKCNNCKNGNRSNGCNCYRHPIRQKKGKKRKPE